MRLLISRKDNSGYDFLTSLNFVFVKKLYTVSGRKFLPFFELIRLAEMGINTSLMLMPFYC